MLAYCGKKEDEFMGGRTVARDELGRVINCKFEIEMHPF